MNRKLIAEAIGTATLVILGCGTAMLVGCDAASGGGYILTALACGLRSGLYIYIFNQFFRGLPKEIEEAAFVDGAGTWYTYFRMVDSSDYFHHEQFYLS